MTDKTIKEKILTVEQQVELSILDRQIEIAKEVIKPKFELVVAKKKELATVTEAYNDAHAKYTEAYKEILNLEAKINAIVK